jgi:hypothetical protein
LFAKDRQRIGIVRIFRYILPLLLIAIAWYAFQQFVVKDRPEGFEGLKAQLWEKAQHFHWAVGVVAALIIIVIIVRFLLQVIKFL